jgi:hypothetical protein
MDRATRRSAEGRLPIDNGTRAFGVAVHQIRASNTGSQPASPRAGASTGHLLEIEELTVLTAWAEAAAEALAHAPERASAVISEARAGAAWRQALGLKEPSQQLGAAIDSMGKAVHAALQPGNPRTLEQLASALRANVPARIGSRTPLAPDWFERCPLSLRSAGGHLRWPHGIVPTEPDHGFWIVSGTVSRTSEIEPV